MIGKQPQGVAVHEEAVTLGIINGDRPVGGHGMTGQFIIEAVVASQHIAVDGIIHHHMIEGLTEAQLTVVEQAIARQPFPLVGEHRAVE